MRRRYVYYRVAAADAADVTAAVRAAQAILCERHPKCTAELLRRVDGDSATLMEVWCSIDDAAAAIEQTMVAAVARWPIGARHVEVFDTVD